MQMFLLNIAQSIMGFITRFNKLLDSTGGNTDNKETEVDKVFNDVFKPVIDILDSMLLPILILLGTAGSIYAIVLGVNYSKAESADKREEAKKRMINAIIGIVVTLLLLILLKLFTANADTIAEWIQGFDPQIGRAHV